MAIQDPTTNYGWNIPNVGADAGAWGTLLNTIIGDDVTGIDAVLKAVSNVANAALPKAGGTMTGEVELLTERYVEVAKGEISGAQSLDLATGNFFTAKATGAITWTFSNPVSESNRVGFFILELENGGAGTQTWPAGTKWPGGTPPSLVASGIDVLVFYTRNGGTTWRGALTMGDSK